jgi:hypothetical protein
VARCFRDAVRGKAEVIGAKRRFGAVIARFRRPDHDFFESR